jgi:hypothetical protein
MPATFEKLFRPSAIKIDRALSHIENLKNEIDIFLNQSPFRLVVVNNWREGKKILKFEILNPIPENFSAIIGDAIHNLRAALDLCIYGLIGSDAIKKKNVAFPFGENQLGFEEALTRTEVFRANDSIIKLIRDVRPYKGGNDLLYGLHVLDIFDKHRTLVTTGRNIELSVEVVARIMNVRSLDGDGIMSIQHDKEEICVLATAPMRRSVRRANGYSSCEITVPDIQPNFIITFGPDELFPQAPVIDKLNELMNEVNSIVRDLCLAASKTASQAVRGVTGLDQ